jgi:dihydrofolate reductase
VESERSTSEDCCCRRALLWCPGDDDGAAALAHLAEVTEIDADFEGDAFAPQLGPHWKEVGRESHSTDGGLRYSFVTLHNTLRGD